MAFIKIESLISAALKRAGVKKHADTALALERAAKAIKDFLGEDALDDLQPLYIKNRSLAIASLNSSAAARVGIVEDDILFFVNHGLESPIADRVKVILT